eukprot:TRINITY_DN226_c0_g1_i1.p2 TRINITY_DN226_c0_g1~~TRINITY_DN226_c0_g1_i1.p2  ORF type:complete len:190 (+),score=36.95 TRINITY_DN226_c0_g1_i1:89-658(+)
MPALGQQPAVAVLTAVGRHTPENAEILRSNGIEVADDLNGLTCAELEAAGMAADDAKRVLMHVAKSAQQRTRFSEPPLTPAPVSPNRQDSARQLQRRTSFSPAVSSSAAVSFSRSARGGSGSSNSLWSTAQSQASSQRTVDIRVGSVRLAVASDGGSRRSRSPSFSVSQHSSHTRRSQSAAASRSVVRE